MRPIIKSLMAAIVFAVMIAPVASATPFCDSIDFNLRIWNDCPTSVLTTVDNYDAYVSIEDTQLGCPGYANLHNWHLAVGGVEVPFNNTDDFALSATLKISGTADGEAGLQVAPWWSHDADGRFNVRSTDGEIACFGGRLPFYSFTATYGLHYVKGELIRLTVIYLSHDLTQASPATIEYVLSYQGSTYFSGPLAFDEGNPAEGYGSWGMLNDARVGAYCQLFLQSGNYNAGVLVEWSNIDFNPFSILTQDSSWSDVKALY